MTCKCVRVADALKLTLGGHDLPHCEEHDPAPEPAGAPLALNDDAGLIAVISRAVGAPVNRTTDL